MRIIASRMPAGAVPEQHVGAADHHGDEALDHEGRAHGRDQRHGRRIERAAQAREAGADAEAQRVHAARAHARAPCAIEAFCIVARAMHAEARLA